MLKKFINGTVAFIIFASTFLMVVSAPVAKAAGTGKYVLRTEAEAGSGGVFWTPWKIFAGAPAFQLDDTTTADDDDYLFTVDDDGMGHQSTPDHDGVGNIIGADEKTDIDLSTLGNSVDYLNFIEQLYKKIDHDNSVDSELLEPIEGSDKFKVKEKTYYRPTIWEISQSGITKLFKEKYNVESIGVIGAGTKEEYDPYPLNIHDSTVALADYLTVQFIEKFNAETTTMTFEDLTTIANSVFLFKTYDKRPYTSQLFPALKVATGDTSIESFGDLYNYIQGEKKERESVIAKNIGTGHIETTYIKPIVESNYLAGSAALYDKYKASLYALTTDVNNAEVRKLLYEKIRAFIDPVGTGLGFVQGATDREKLLDLVLTKIAQDNTGLNSDGKILAKRLYSIVEQRSSTNSLQSSNPFDRGPADLTIVPAYGLAETKADDINASIEALINSRANSNTDDVKQKYTVNLRLQYHYWAMQYLEIGTSTADLLSTSTSGGTYFRRIEPIKVANKFLVTPVQYTNFMNAANEIPYMREIFMNELAGNILAGTSLYGDLIDQVIYLRQLKNGIEFLQSVDSTDFDTTPIINYWYEKVPVKGTTEVMSLEEVYNRAQELGLVDDDATPYENKEPQRPLTRFFNESTGELNDYLKMGISQSATYIPMKTNVYETTTYRNIKNEGFYRFHYQWGYHRKALYIDTNIKAAVDYYTNGKKGKLKVATLEDMLQPEKDIVLYVDDNFYNVDQLAEMQDKTLNRLNNQGTSSNTSFWGRIWDWATQVFSIDIMEIVKTSEKDKYSKTLRGITPYEEAVDKNPEKVANGEEDGYGVDADDVTTSKNYAVLGKDGIDKYLKPLEENTDDPSQFKGEGDYSVVQAFAFVSAVYRDSKLFDFLNRNTQLPVFISSGDLYSARQASVRDKMSIFNYALLKNLDSNMVVSYMSNMDRQSPLYLDIYGNILTESGYVVVPAAANATLQEVYDPYTAAFLTTYGESYKLPTTYKGLGTTQDGQEGFIDVLEENREDGVWQFVDRAVGFDTKVDINRLSTASSSAMDTLYKIYNIQFKENFRSDLYISNVFMEVVRGAPIENINKEFESLNAGREISRSGIINGVKLDRLKNSLEMNSQNAILSIPNLAFIEGIEYVVLFTYKAVIIICIVMILIQIFVSAMQQKVGLQTIIGIVMTLSLTLASIFTVPLVFSLTYYQSNKALLQSETEYIAMLNYEKEEAGVEIGMTTVGAPNTETQLLLKVQDINVPWYDLFYKIIYAPVTSNMRQIYEDAASNNLAMSVPEFQLKSDVLYMDMQDLFDSSYVLFDSSFESDFATLYQTTSGELPASFYTPYYVFLDSLIGNVNVYNSKNDVYSYTTAMYKGSKTKTLGLIKEYFESDEFIEDDTHDLLRLRPIYGLDVNTQEEPIFDMSDIEMMRQSQWLDINHSSEDVEPRVDKLNKEARTFVLENKDLIGKISDETFLKVMALHLALMHNKLFGVDSFQNIEIFNLSVDDLTRLSVADREEVMKGSPLSYTRFVYNISGEVGIYLSAVLSIIVYAAGWIKPTVTIIMFLVLFVTFFIYKIILRRKSDSIAGYFKIFALICLCNVLYAGLIKVSMWLPEVFAPAVCLLIQIILQLLFLAVYAYIATISVKNWRDLASEHLNINAATIRDFFLNRVDRTRERGLRDAEEDPNSGWRKYKIMKDNDKARKYTIRRRNDI